MAPRMSAADRRTQVLAIAAKEFAQHGLHGASIDEVAREAGITQAYVFRIFGTKKALFLELVQSAFARVSDGMRESAQGKTGLQALSSMGRQYYDLLDGGTGLRLQLQGFAACGDSDVRDAVRDCFAGLWDTAADGTGLDPVTVKSFLAYGMLLNVGSALDVDHVDAPWADGIRTRIQPGLFAHITAETNR